MKAPSCIYEWLDSRRNRLMGASPRLVSLIALRPQSLRAIGFDIFQRDENEILHFVGQVAPVLVSVRRISDTDRSRLSEVSK